MTRTVSVRLTEEQYALIERVAACGTAETVTEWARSCLVDCAEIQNDENAVYRLADFRERLLALWLDAGDHERNASQFTAWNDLTLTFLEVLGLDVKNMGTDRTFSWREHDGAVSINPDRLMKKATHD